MGTQPTSKIEASVKKAAQSVLARDGKIGYPALFQEMVILSRRDVEDWRAGRIPYLEKVIQSNLTRLARIQKALRTLARENGWKRSSTVLKHRGQTLRFSKTGNEFVEEEYRAVYLPGRVPAKETAASRPAGPEVETGPG